MLSHLAQIAASRKRTQLVGRFIPTKKNAPARQFYPQHGFQKVEENLEGSVWRWSLQQNTIAIPDWIRLKTSQGDHN